MSKSRKRFEQEDTYEDREDFFDFSNHNKRKEKRLQKALKTRNIDELLDLEDEEQ